MAVKKFDLNIERILDNWEVYHALREIIANALDEQTITNSQPIKIFFDEEKKLHIKDFGRGIRYEHLTQNENEEKLKHPNLIGKFGVGLKDALATFDRKEIKVLIKSKHNDIILGRSEKNDFHDIITLHAYIMKASDPKMDGTEFIITGCKEEDLYKAKELFLLFSEKKLLESTQYGEVFENNSISSIYINGVKISEEENFLFSYNITSLTASIKKSLNRERTNVGRIAYADRVKSILLQCKSETVINKLVTDLNSYERGTIHDELKWVDVASHASKIANSQSKVIFMTPSELQDGVLLVERAKQNGYEILTIPDNLKEKISGQVDVEGNEIVDLNFFQRDLNNNFYFNFVARDALTESEIKILDKIPFLFKLIGGKPEMINEIKISETMQLDENTYFEAVGLWKKPDIIIKRSVLKNESSFFGTLLHEIAHATSFASDMSLKFESELTNLLGIITSYLLKELEKAETSER